MAFHAVGTARWVKPDPGGRPHLGRPLVGHRGGVQAHLCGLGVGVALGHLGAPLDEEVRGPHRVAMGRPLAWDDDEFEQGGQRGRYSLDVNQSAPKVELKLHHRKIDGLVN